MSRDLYLAEHKAREEIKIRNDSIRQKKARVSAQERRFSMWYEASLKDSERKLAAPRIWQKLEGAAKSVVKHLEPKDFATETGMNKLLGVLRESPLQKLPIPDSFSRLEKWTGLRRNGGESIPQLLVREEEPFVELQQALQRARAERLKREVRSMGVGAQNMILRHLLRDHPM
eukprot:g7127.t1